MPHSTHIPVRARARRLIAGAVALPVLATLGACSLTSGAPVAAPTTAAAVLAPTTEPPVALAPTTTAAPTPSTPAPLLAEGAKGDQVRELQARLKQLKTFTATVDGIFAATTTSAVSAFQTAKRIPATGTVDQPTWDLLLAGTRTPTAEDLAGHLIPGPALLAVGSTGPLVRELQARLKQLGRWNGDVTSTYGSVTAGAVKGYQTKRGLPATGEVDQRTKDRIWSQTRKPTTDELNNVKPVAGPGLTAAGWDPRCLTGRVICASKASRAIMWFVDGVPILRLDARFGAPTMPTTNGVHTVYLKSRNHVSTKYNNAPMPFSLFFHGGEAVHYSSTFAQTAWNLPGSHGCINIRNYSQMGWLFDQVQIGDKVIVS